MRAVREEALSRFLLRSLGQQQRSGEEPVSEWGPLAAATESALAQAISMTNGYASLRLEPARSEAWRRIVEILATGQESCANQRGDRERQLRPSRTTTFRRFSRPRAP